MLILKIKEKYYTFVINLNFKILNVIVFWIIRKGKVKTVRKILSNKKIKKVLFVLKIDFVCLYKS